MKTGFWPGPACRAAGTCSSMANMSALNHQLSLSAPLFLLVLAGYLLARVGGWPRNVSEALSRFVFTVAMPAMLFHLMSNLSRLPAVDPRVLLAFFGSCLIVFGLGRLVGWRLFGLDGVAQSVFALGGVFSNNVMLGVPLARLLLGEAALPTVALVLVFNALILWTLVTVSVEWARHGQLSAHGFARTARGVLSNPQIVAILSGTLCGIVFQRHGLALPAFIDATLGMIADTAAPMALIALGMSLAWFSVREGWAQSAAISMLKLVVQPLVVWGLARALGLSALETQAVVLLGSIAVGVNVYMMSTQFRVLEGAIAGSLVLSTLMSALSTPVLLALTAG